MTRCSIFVIALRTSRDVRASGDASIVRVESSSCSLRYAEIGSDFSVSRLKNTAGSVISPNDSDALFGGSITQPSRDVPSKIRVMPGGSAALGAASDGGPGGNCTFACIVAGFDWADATDAGVSTITAM